MNIIKLHHPDGMTMDYDTDAQAERKVCHNALPRSDDAFAGFKDMDDLDSAPMQPQQRAEPNEVECTLGNQLVTTVPSKVLFEERCEACSGTGRFRSYTGRVVGQCFKCKGAGVRKFKQPRHVRDAQRASAHDRKAQEEKRKAQELSLNVRNWVSANPARFAWLTKASSYSAFAADLLGALNRFGSLSEAQGLAIDRNINRDASRAAERKQQEVDPKALDLSPLPSGFYAVPDGDTRLKLRVRVINDPANKWHGWVFVDDGAEYGHQKKYGSQRPNARYAGQCVEALRLVLQDPMAASAAYGHLVGCCGVCGRKLEDETSVRLGIGPICLRKFGG